VKQQYQGEEEEENKNTDKVTMVNREQRLLDSAYNV
jgi:hypothetical protein